MKRTFLLFALSWVFASVAYGSGQESLCTALSANCICSEPMNTSGYTNVVTSLWKANDTNGTQCQIGSGGVIDTNMNYPADWFATNTGEAITALPAGHTNTYVLRLRDGVGGSHKLGHRDTSSPWVRSSVRFYVYHSANFASSSGGTPGTCQNTKLATAPEAGLYSSTILTRQSGDGLASYNYVDWTPSVDCCNDGPGSQNNLPDSYWIGKWIRVEIVTINRTGNGNLVHGTGPIIQVYTKDVTNNGPLQLVLDTSQTTGVSPNDGRWNGSQNRTAPGGGLGLFYIENYFQQGTAACVGWRAQAYYMAAQWNTNAGQMIGAAVEMEGSGPPPTDTTPPTVSITAPANGATVSSTISVSGTASDNVGVVGVQFKLDGQNLGAEDTSAPYSISWNTSLVSNGAHTLTATARDAAGNTATSASISVTVNNVPQPFDFSLSNSGSLSLTAGSSATNTISAALVSGSTQAVSFSASGLPTGATASFSPASCSPSCSSTLTINTGGSTPAGSSTTTVTATGGGVTRTTTFSLTVSLPTVATPTISPNGGSFTGSVSVTLQTATVGASIYYTTNGSTPTQSSTLYTGAMTLTGSTVLNAIAFKSGSNASAQAGATFTLSATSSLTNECSNPQAEWIWCDDFETNRLGSYFEYDNSGGDFVPMSGLGVNGSSGMRVIYRPGQSGAGNLKLAFGSTPSSYFRAVDAGTAKYREVYWRMYVQNQPGWTGGGGDKLSRAIVFANSAWAEATIGHVWSGSPGAAQDYLVLDPASGTDTAGNLLTTGYNDFAHFTWLGAQQGTTPLFNSSNVGQWHCVETHMKLNNAGQSDGLFEFSVDGNLDAQRTGLNWLGSYSAFGINAIFFENYWNATSPVVEQRYIDNIVVSTQPIGCGLSAAPPAPTGLSITP
jgi:hypothetical protein